jgi:Na+-translocating ferredoxin:NAD+ oxidoreductase RnfD subunit
MIAAGLVDLLILRRKTGTWRYPSGALLTAAIVVMVLRAQEPWYVPTATSVIAVLSKYCFRAQANVFNPAALAMVASYYLFHAGESWWGAQTDAIGLGKLLMMVAGVIVANRVNKMPLVLTFLRMFQCIQCA